MILSKPFKDFLTQALLIIGFRYHSTKGFLPTKGFLAPNVEFYTVVLGSERMYICPHTESDLLSSQARVICFVRHIPLVCHVRRNSEIKCFHYQIRHE